MGQIMATKQYSEGFKKRMIERICGPEAISLSQLSREIGVSPASLSRWSSAARRAASSHTDAKVNTVTEKLRPQDRSPEEKLRLVIEAGSLSDDELGAFLRTNGIHKAQLDQWREEAIGGLKPKPRKRTLARDKKRIRSLEKDLKRKEKALAEAAALLMLQKKVQALFSQDEDEK